MKSLQLAKERASGTQRNLLRLLGILFTGLITSSAFASEGESVRLHFAKSDNTVLIVAAVLGLVGIAMAYMLSQSVLKNDRGSEGMKEVQDAIEDGARAYLTKQIKMMIPFILILMVLLFALNFGSLKATAALVSLTFVLGVISSYASGFAGMIMAVKGNARVAAAALTSNKKALEIAFKSGSVAGLATVGIGLFCSSVILVAMPKIATTLLVGYGFGGSLAALFMRVGGGIYTKAADVGADLVGKVEQSMPEDSPRNPATIADNVGDNVGDCAGMAADVFESYEVMLVATIVLGAATSAILDGSVWPKLIVFALAACGLGIVASIFGIQLVKGSDDLETDPLKPILTGFRISGLISAIGVCVLAFTFLRKIDVVDLVTQSSASNRMNKTILQVRDEIAKSKSIQKSEVKATDVIDDPRVKAMDLGKNAEQIVGGTLNQTPEKFKDSAGLVGYREVTQDEINSVSIPSLRYAAQRTPDDQADTVKYETVADKFSEKNHPIAVKLTVEQGSPAQAGAPAQSNTMKVWVGGSTEALMNKQFETMAKSAAANGSTFKVKPDKSTVLPIKLYYNEEQDKFAIVAGVGVDKPESFQAVEQLTYFRKSVSDMDAFEKKAKEDPKITPPEPVQFELASSQVTASAPWWKFALAVIFGILMALGIEALTNYYVGTTKRPTREVAGVATAGPAPMIIQGIAYAAESSVFMVLAIVVALMVPLFLFPAAVFGSMTLGFYGIALVGLGLLTTTGYILAMDTFGPISDNAQGVFEMSGSGDNEYGSKSLQRLDAAGNTTKALTKGFAIATAVVAAVALFQSFVGAGHLQESGLRIDTPEIFMGLLIGAAAPFLFCSFAINAVGRSAFELINEVRRQFKEKPGILKGTDKPDYGRCVAIVTAAAQRELLGPGILAICLPLAVGFGFSLLPGGPVTIGDHEFNLRGAQALGGFLAGAIASGQLMAVLLANSGGMWDNSKKLIEDGYLGGKGTDAHKAAVVCDTVGDPFKDTAGPALNPLIKVMNLVALLVVGAVTATSIGTPVRAAITIISIGLLVFAFMRSKKGSLADMMQHMGD